MPPPSTQKGKISVYLRSKKKSDRANIATNTQIEHIEHIKLLLEEGKGKGKEREREKEKNRKGRRRKRRRIMIKRKQFFRLFCSRN